MLGREQQAIQTNRTQIGFGTHLEREKTEGGREKQAMEITPHYHQFAKSWKAKAFRCLIMWVRMVNHTI